MSSGTRIVWVDQSEGWRFPCYAWRDADVKPLDTFQSEAYVCGEHPPHYPVPVKTDTDTTIYYQWFANDDGFWNWVRS
jgi:hypothetical protein